MTFVLENFVWFALGAGVLLILALAMRANFAYDRYLAKLEKYKAMPASFKGKAEDFADMLCKGVFGGQIAMTALGEDGPEGNYTPAMRTIGLKQSLFGEASIASLAVISHEAGHALQHLYTPKKLQKHFSLQRLVGFLGGFNWLAFFAGITLAILGQTIGAAVFFGAIVVSFVIAVALKVVTLNLEKNASEMAIDMLKKKALLPEDDILKIKKFLGYAKGTYTADFLQALLGWTGLARKTNFF